MTLRRRMALIGIATLALVLWSFAAAFLRSAWLVGATPVLLAGWLVVATYHGYFLLRALRWRQRQAEEKVALAALVIPEQVQRPEAFEGVQDIDEAEHSLLPKAPDYQGMYRAKGIVVAVLPPLALLFIFVQALYFAGRGTFGAGMVLGEALLLFCLIVLVWTRPGPTQEWVEGRIRAELMRREQYLRLAMVGPYLGLSSGHARRSTVDRIELIASADLDQLRRLTPMAPVDTIDTPGTWVDELWNRAPDAGGLSDLCERMRCYLHYRIGKQVMWFELGVRSNERPERWIAQPLKVAVVLALTAALLHFGLHIAGIGESQAETGDIALASTLTVLLAAVLPPISAALLGLQSLFSFNTLAYSYGETRRELLRQRASLQLLIDRYGESDDDGRRHRVAMAFQALVLETESVLTREMERCIMIVQRREFEVAA
jgi:hypothetical protein